MQRQKRTLVDHFFLSEASFGTEARILERFGSAHEDDLPPNVGHFLCPDDMFSPSLSAEPASFSFVLTSAEGQHSFGVSLYWLLPMDERDATAVEAMGDDPAPPTVTVLSILSQFPFVSLFVDYLREIYNIGLGFVREGETVLPVERYLTNLCLECPAPLPGWRVELSGTWWVA
jgi:hypothetical protein